MASIDFRAQEYRADTTFQEVPYRYEGDPDTGWEILREGRKILELPAGYRLLRSVRCGICATDLARHFLPFPLPQVTGHEVVARDENDRIVTAEINASHLAVGSPLAEACPFCRNGLDTHCPDRMTLGIDRLPGGFAPWILVPKNNVLEIPPGFSMSVSVLIEPFAAALHAARTMGLAGATRVAVLGAGRLGLLIVAALRGAREMGTGSFSIEAIDPNPVRLHMASSMGADVLWPDADAAARELGGRPCFDVVVESTGSSQGMDTAVSLAAREVHVKSTTGQETLGLQHLTELVVDEVSLARFDPETPVSEAEAEPDGERTAILLGGKVAAGAARPLEKAGFQVRSFRGIEEIPRPDPGEASGRLEQADLVVVDSVEAVDQAIRPWSDLERGIVVPRGTILVADVGQSRAGLLDPLLERGVRISTSRCGDFHEAIKALQALEELKVDLGALVTEVLPVAELAHAFERARSPENIKVAVDHS
jgi:threonine dehydrogenase-like Zn-dependent dehydrogenase